MEKKQHEYSGFLFGILLHKIAEGKFDLGSEPWTYAPRLLIGLWMNLVLKNGQRKTIKEKKDTYIQYIINSIFYTAHLWRSGRGRYPKSAYTHFSLSFEAYFCLNTVYILLKQISKSSIQNFGRSSQHITKPDFINLNGPIYIVCLNKHNYLNNQLYNC